jgi:hypothetical protein
MPDLSIQIHDPEDTLENNSSDTSDEEDAAYDGLDFVLATRKKSRTIHHPQSEQINLLWQIFVENVDPMTKVVHTPSLQPAIERSANNVKTIPRSFEPLMFAI